MPALRTVCKCNPHFQTQQNIYIVFHGRKGFPPLVLDFEFAHQLVEIRCCTGQGSGTGADLMQ